ncbi:hypothetical protein Fmac_011118 [Flemingia macrophylla]|uniref:Uncharacterized protein n=1 Tax=Flemingia macrophylla TaxID=520843 RepID=A0ABD1MLI0_9FABA
MLKSLLLIFRFGRTGSYLCDLHEQTVEKEGKVLRFQAVLREYGQKGQTRKRCIQFQSNEVITIVFEDERKETQSLTIAYEYGLNLSRYVDVDLIFVGCAVSRPGSASLTLSTNFYIKKAIKKAIKDKLKKETSEASFYKSLNCEDALRQSSFSTNSSHSLDDKSPLLMKDIKEKWDTVRDVYMTMEENHLDE